MSQNTRSLLQTSSLVVMTLMSIAIGLYAYGFQLRFTGDPSFHMRFDELIVPSTMHVIGGGTVLLIGGLQFFAAIRRNYPALHRWLGRIYLSFAIIGGIGGLILAPVSDGGLVAHYGFGTLAVLWLFSSIRAYTAIRGGNVQAHQEWMMRNYAMAFGAVTLRIYLGLFGANGIPFEESYPVTAWISWVPNLILVEWYLSLKRERRASVGRTVEGSPAFQN